MHRADRWQAVLASALRPSACVGRSCTTLAGYLMHRRLRFHVNRHCAETPMALASAKSSVTAGRSGLAHGGIGISFVYEGVLVRRVCADRKSECVYLPHESVRSAGSQFRPRMTGSRCSVRVPKVVGTKIALWCVTTLGSSRARCPVGCVGAVGRRNVWSEVALESSGEMTVLFTGGVLAQPANPWLERTAGQRCWPVPFALRATAAAQPQRWASCNCSGGSNGQE